MPPERHDNHPGNGRWGAAPDGRPLCARPRIRWYVSLPLILTLILLMHLTIAGLSRIFPWSGWESLRHFQVVVIVMPFVRYYAFRRHNSEIAEKALEAQLILCTRCAYDLRELGGHGRCPECGQEFDLAIVRKIWKAWLSTARGKDFNYRRPRTSDDRPCPPCKTCRAPLAEPGAECRVCAVDEDAR